MRDSDGYRLRKKIIDVVNVSRQGHIRSAFSCLEMVRSVYDVMKEGDKFILSKGHGCLAQYVVMWDKGLLSEDDLFKFCKEGALLGGHPSPKLGIGTGSLGHGLSIGIGFALADRTKKVYVLLGDGECNEGSVWEAALCASKHHLSNLTVLIDYNEQQSYGTTHEVCELEPLIDKWEAFDWLVRGLDGHDINKIKVGLGLVSISRNPKCLICHTIKGKGIKLTEEDLRWHHKTDITDEQIKSLYEGLNA
jgi:transketolase